jgi:hypothetical protein
MKTPERWSYDHRRGAVVDKNDLLVARLPEVDDPEDQRAMHEDGELLSAAPDLAAALSVFVLDLRIRPWLEAHYPTALRQAEVALVRGWATRMRNYERRRPCRTRKTR